MGGTGAERSTPTGCPGGEDEGPGRCEKNQTNHPTQEEVPWSRRREKSGVGSEYGKKMLIIDERSRNVYENKQKDDNLSVAKGEDFA
jgi:hypothetical protein